MKLVSFNLRCPVKNDGINYLPNRIPFVVQKLRMELPDVIGFQEIEELGTELLTDALPEYWFIGYGRNKDWTGEGTKVAIHKNTVLLLAFDQLWLSPTPRVPGSRYAEQSDCPRVVLWCKLLHKSSGKMFYFINTHLDHRGDRARFLGLQMIFDLIKQLKLQEDLPVFVTGDFNFTPESITYDLIRESGFIDLTDKLQGTFHGFGKVEPQKIDYILTDSEEEYTSFQWHEFYDGVYLSDHDPICLEWKI